MQSAIVLLKCQNEEEKENGKEIRDLVTIFWLPFWLHVVSRELSTFWFGVRDLLTYTMLQLV